MAASWWRTAFSFLRKLPSSQGLQRTEVGVDTFGNRYFELRAPGAADVKRVVLTDSDESSYDPSKIPVAWSVWLNGGRLDPPTDQELADEVTRRAVLAERVKAIKQRDNTAQSLPTGHAAASIPLLHKQAPSTEPKSHNNVFQPGEWVPGGKQ